MSRQSGTVAASHAPAAQWLALAAVAWGAFAFGAVYPWAAWPLAVLCLAAGVAGLASGSLDRSATSPAFRMTLVIAALAVLAQVVPLPVSLLKTISLPTDDLLRRINPAYAMGLTAWRPLSIAATDTWRALGLIASFVCLVLGLSRAMTLTGARGIVGSLAVVAFLLGLVGIIQQPLYAGSIYRFWQPDSSGGAVFGPFVNRNHFAGWMLMSLPLSFALMGSGLQHAWRGVKPAWRYRILWMSSPEASRLLLLALAIVVMTLSLVLTTSRSGMSALALAIVLTGCAMLRGLPGLTRKAAGMFSLALLVGAVVSWVGVNAVVGRFADADWSEYNNRRGAWSDARAVAAAFPVAGTGLNTYHVTSLVYQRHDLRQHYAQAHNDYLQLAAEGGLLLLLPLAGCIIVFARDVRRRLREDRLASTAWWLRRGAVTALVAIALQETVDFSLQMPGNAALFAVVCAIALHRAPAQPLPRPHTSRNVAQVDEPGLQA
ncbi:MAG: O-antigen ligase family protein [Vicinamibacterales bacterium]